MAARAAWSGVNRMVQWLKNLDELLRGERTRADLLERGEFELPLGRFVGLAVGLGALYGFFMGWYSVANTEPARWQQMLAGMVKVPALFLFTLLVTFPSLYVFNALVGTRLSFLAALRLLVAAIVVTLTVAASLGTIVAFFTLSTTSYSFMVMLNVVMLGLSGLIGMGFLLVTLRKMSLRRWRPGTVVPSAGGEEVLPGQIAAPPMRPPPDGAAEGSAGVIFTVWVVIFGFVGAQMAWLLRPFIGSPDLPWEFLRPRHGNFFQSISDHIGRLLGM
jgi:hypothetical protein